MNPFGWLKKKFEDALGFVNRKVIQPAANFVNQKVIQPASQAVRQIAAPIQRQLPASRVLSQFAPVQSPQEVVSQASNVFSRVANSFRGGGMPSPTAGPDPNNMGIVPSSGVRQLPIRADYGDAPGPAHYKVPGKWWNEGAHIEGNGIPGRQTPVRMPRMLPPVVPGKFFEDSPGVPVRRWPGTPLLKARTNLPMDSDGFYRDPDNEYRRITNRV